MKKLPLILLIIFIFSFVSFKKPNQETSIVGYIHSYGNLPFNYPVIHTDDGKKIAVKADTEIKYELLNTTGHKIQIKGILNKSDDIPEYETADDGNITLISWKIIE